MVGLVLDTNVVGKQMISDSWGCLKIQEADQIRWLLYMYLAMH